MQLGLGPSRVLAIRTVPVPETSVHKNDFTSAPEHQVWISRQAAVVQPVSVPHTVDQAPDRHLRLRVLRPNPAHPLTALHGGQGVHTASLFLTTVLPYRRERQGGIDRKSTRLNSSH